MVHWFPPVPNIKAYYSETNQDIVMKLWEFVELYRHFERYGTIEKGPFRRRLLPSLKLDQFEHLYLFTSDIHI